MLDATFKSQVHGFTAKSFDPTTIPDFNTEFVGEGDIDRFAEALSKPESSPVIALNDWRPVHQRVKRKKSRTSKKQRSNDETREGFVYTILKWPFLFAVLGWTLFLCTSYAITRTYIWAYERFFTWRGERQRLRRNVRSQIDYDHWRLAAEELDAYLGNNRWKETDDYAYYDFKTVTKVKEQLQACRAQAKAEEKVGGSAVGKLRGLVEASVKNNFVGVENPRLYSECYYGTKNLAQDFVDELHTSLNYLLHSSQLSNAEKCAFAKQVHTNFGRTAFCLSGGASFAWYHFGVAKALLDASLLPDIITGTSGGALVAALIATRTDDELKQILVPALAHRIRACEDTFLTWTSRWWHTGARFDSLKWARQCGWFTRGSTTFREAYERTGRILNVSCVPSDPHSPTILTNYLTSPDCVIWSAVLASAAVPGILNPVVLMMKSDDGSLKPYAFGHKYLDGSLRTDIPLRALNLHFDVNFSIVSQVNPHINLFFFSSRGAVGRPVTHRKGRGWRGGYLGSAIETYLKLELQKFVKISKHLELLPRPLGQEWSGVWLQIFSGTVTIWPKTLISDFWYILSDPTPERLARMLAVGQQSTFPKILFIQNRMKIERLIEEGLSLGSPPAPDMKGMAPKSMDVQQQAQNDSMTEPVNGHIDNNHSVGGNRRPSMMEEFKRQMLFDNSELESEGSDEETVQ